MQISTATSASIGLPSIGRDFDVEEDKLQWVLSSYSLSSVGPPLLLFAVRMLILNHCDRWQGCLLIFFGRLADLHGRKKAFLLGVFWLCAFSLGCGFANSVIALDILRAFQGLGAAAFVPASASAFMSLSQTFDLNIGLHFRLASSLTLFPVSRARSVAFATFSAGAPIGGAVGLLLGGVLTQWAPYAFLDFLRCYCRSFPKTQGNVARTLFSYSRPRRSGLHRRRTRD